MRTKNHLIGAVLTLALLGTNGCKTGGTSRVGNFTVRDTTGRYISLRSYQDATVLLFFWNTMDSASVAELRYLDKLQVEHMTRGLVVLAGNNDPPQTRAKARSVIMREKLKLTSFMDIEGSAQAVFGDVSMPCHVVLIHKNRLVDKGTLCEPRGRAILKRHLKRVLTGSQEI